MSDRKILGMEGLAIEFQQGDPETSVFVFVHGNTQNSSCGKGLLEFFQAKGHSTLTYDLPGHGCSDWGPYDYHFDDLITLNHEILQSFQLQKPILCGHSLGGMMQAGTIARYDFEVSSLILCGSLDGNPVDLISKQDEALGESMRAYLDEYIRSGSILFKQQKFYDYFANRQLDDAFIEIMNRRYNQPAASAINLTTLSGFNVRAELSRKDIPILVIHGEEETVIPKVLIEEMQSNYENLIVAWLNGVGHNGFYQQHEQTEVILQRHYSFVCGA